jgi:uncharacterized protein
MAAKFEISKDTAGKFRFHLKAANGEIIASGQGYKLLSARDIRVCRVRVGSRAALFRWL